MLGLPILNYDVAIRENVIGCMSPSMIGKNQQLIEGIQYLQAYNRNFNPENKSDRDLYSFQLIEKSLEFSGFSIFMRRIIEIIIFDSIIGNQDRHQENWGVIIEYTAKNTLKVPTDEMREDYRNLLLLVGKNSGYRSHETQEYKAYQDLTFNNQQNFAPIYDCGSSLGRELSPKNVRLLLSDQSSFDRYLSRGKSEIRWNNAQLNHTNLVYKVLTESDYADAGITLKNILSNYSERNFRYLMELIDKNIPVTFAHLKIPEERKELIIRLVNTIVELLRTLLRLIH